ncbi:MAG: hypothetical protein JO127_10000 [Caulobacteraceae bacterium]|nr:hypothetical protein [Caulobacteraceae bacterium]
MRQELTQNGRTPSYARLAQLRGAIQDNLGSTISDVVQSQRAQVAAGQIEPADTLEARLSSAWTAKRDQWLQQRQQQAAGPSASAGSIGDATGGTVAVPSLGGTEFSPGQGSGGAAGASGLSGAPTFDAEGAQRLAAATAQTKQRAQTFGTGPIGNVLAKAGAADLYTMPGGSVPAQFFHGGNTSPEAIRQLLTASPEAAGPLADYAAWTLRRQAQQPGGTLPDGTISPKAFASWQRTYGQAINALPEDVQARFADADTASQAVADAAVARAQALANAKLGAVGRVMNLTEPQDVVRTVGNILGGNTAVADMKALANSASADPAATQGLRQAVADHIAGQFVNPDGALGQQSFRSFVKAKRGALANVFSPAELDNLDAIAADIDRSRSVAATKVGSQGLAGKIAHGGAHFSLDAAGTILGAVLGHHIGLDGEWGALAGGAVTDLAQRFRAAGVARVDQLVSQALLDPALARRLLVKISPNAKPTAYQSAIRGVISALGASNGFRPATVYASPSSPQLPQMGQ